MYQQKANSLEFANRYRDAISCYDQMINLNPNDIQTYCRKCNLLEKLGQYEEGIRYCDQALKLNSGNGRFYLWKAVFLEKLGRYQEAISYYNKLKNPHQACLLNKLCKYEDAIIFLDEAIKIDPREKKYYYLKLELLRKLGKYQDAISCCDQAIMNEVGFSPDYISKKGSYYQIIYFQLYIKNMLNNTFILEDLEKYQDAISCREELAKQKPQSVQSSRIASLLYKMGKYEDAINYCNQVINFTENFNCYWIKAESLGKQGKHEDTISCYDQLIKLNQYDELAYWRKAAALNKLDRYEDANNCYDEVIRRFPKFLDKIQNKGELLQILNRKLDAINFKDEEGLRLNLSINQKMLKALDELGKQEESISFYDQAIKLNPLDFKNYCKKADLLVKRQNLKMQSTVTIKQQAQILMTLKVILKKLKHQNSLDVLMMQLNVTMSTLSQILRTFELYLKSALLLEFLWKFEEAAKCYDQAIMLNPENYFKKGQILAVCDLQRFEDAVSSYDQALSLSPQNVDMLCKKVDALNSLYKNQCAIKCYDDIISLVPDKRKVDLYCKQGEIFQRLGEFFKIIKCYDKALRIDSIYFDGYMKKGVSLEKLKLFKESIISYILAKDYSIGSLQKIYKFI